MGHVCRVAILAAIFVMIILSFEMVDSKIKKVEFIVDRASKRRIGYIVTKVHPIDRKDELNETSTTNLVNDNSTTKIDDRNTLGDEDYEHAGEMVLVDQIPDTQAVETSHIPDAQAVETSYGGHEFDGASFSEVHHEHPPPHLEHEKVITITRTVPEPYAVEKTVHIPVYKEVPYVQEVPEPEPFPVIKESYYPVKVVVKVPVKIPKPVAVVKPSFYPVHRIVERPVPHRVYVPDPYPVERKVYYEVQVPQAEPYPLERKVPVPVKVPDFILQPYPVDKIVPYPVRITEERPRPVPVPQPYPVPVNKAVPYYHEKIVPYPVFEKEEHKEEGEVLVEAKKEVVPIHEEKKDVDNGDKIEVESKLESGPEGKEASPKEPAKVREDKAE